MKYCPECIHYKDGFCECGEFQGSKHLLKDMFTAEICRLFKW